MTTQETDFAESKRYVTYLAVLIGGMIVGAGIAIVAYSLRPIEGYKGYGLNIDDYNRLYSIWDYKTHQQIYSFPVGLIPDLDSAINQHEKTKAGH
jgi:hypothetical protein